MSFCYRMSADDSENWREGGLLRSYIRVPHASAACLDALLDNSKRWAQVDCDLLGKPPESH